jgi:hypothetical protein
MAMEYRQEMPRWYPWPDVLRDLLAILGGEIDRLFAAWERAVDQLFVGTAADLSRWEEDVGLNLTAASIEDRRALVLARLRGASLPLLSALRAVEPTISLAFGGWVLPFSFRGANQDEHDLGRLVVVLEALKPAHLGYTLELVPPDPACGFAAVAARPTPDVALAPLAGSLFAGRWPRWNAPGAVASAAAVIAVFVRSGAGQYGFAGEGVGARRATTVSFAFLPVAGRAPYRFSGTAEAAGSGAVASYVTSVGVAAKSATNSFRSCGTFRAGEVI